MTKKSNPNHRMLYMYSILAEGKRIYKNELAVHFACNERTIQRDIEALRDFLAEQNDSFGMTQQLICDRKEGGYYLQPPTRNLLTNEEVFATLKILLESRAFAIRELYPILDKLIDCCLPKTEQAQVKRLIANEKDNYVELQHKKLVLQTIWELAVAVRDQLELTLLYVKSTGEIVERRLQPVGIMFSEFYFYLIAYFAPQEKAKLHLDGEASLAPTVYRIDRIKKYTVIEKHFQVPYASRFKEGEFRKRVQFMYNGGLQRLLFYYKGKTPEYILDRLPTAKILRHEDKGYLIEAEVFGIGIDFWLRSQGDLLEIVKRQDLPAREYN